MAAVLARERPHLVGPPGGRPAGRRHRSPRRRPAPSGCSSTSCRPCSPRSTRPAVDYAAHAGQPELRRRDAGVADGWMGVAGANVTLVAATDRSRWSARRTAPFATRHRRGHRRRRRRFPGGAQLGQRVDVRVGGRPLRFVNTHTEAYDARSATRSATRCSPRTRTSTVPGRAGRRPQRHARTVVGVPARLDGRLDRGRRATGLTCGQAAGPGQPGQRAARAHRLRLGARRRGARCPGRRRPAQADRTTPHRLWPSDHAGVVADLAALSRLSPSRTARAAPWSRGGASCRPAGAPWSRGSAGSAGAAGAGARWPR